MEQNIGGSGVNIGGDQIAGRDIIQSTSHSEIQVSTSAMTLTCQTAKFYLTPNELNESSQKRRRRPLQSLHKEPSSDDEEMTWENPSSNPRPSSKHQLKFNCADMDTHTFVNRSEFPVSSITTKLAESKSGAELFGFGSILVITGLGGLGKSTIVRKFINSEESSSYPQIIWIPAETHSSLLTNFRLLATMLGIGKQLLDMPESILIPRIYQQLSPYKTLIVFDNAENLESDGGKNGISRFTCKNPNLHLIVTTRRTDFGVTSSWTQFQYTLPLLSEQESSTLIIKSLTTNIGRPSVGIDPTIPPIIDKELDTEWAPKLGLVLGYHPLALQQAIAYLNMQRRRKLWPKSSRRIISIQNYIETFEESGGGGGVQKQILDFTRPNCEESDETIFKTWDITLQGIRQSGKNGVQAIQIIETLILMNPDAVPMSFIMELYPPSPPSPQNDEDMEDEDTEDDEMKKEEDDSLTIEHGLELLEKYSMITIFKKKTKHFGKKVPSSFIATHRLVQTVIRLKLKLDKIWAISLSRTASSFTTFWQTIRNCSHLGEREKYYRQIRPFYQSLMDDHQKSSKNQGRSSKGSKESKQNQEIDLELMGNVSIFLHFLEGIRRNYPVIYIPLGSAGDYGESVKKTTVITSAGDNREYDVFRRSTMYKFSRENLLDNFVKKLADFWALNFSDCPNRVQNFDTAGCVEEEVSSLKIMLNVSDEDSIQIEGCLSLNYLYYQFTFLLDFSHCSHDYDAIVKRMIDYMNQFSWTDKREREIDRKPLQLKQIEDFWSTVMDKSCLFVLFKADQLDLTVVEKVFGPLWPKHSMQQTESNSISDLDTTYSIKSRPHTFILVYSSADYHSELKEERRMNQARGIFDYRMVKNEQIQNSILHKLKSFPEYQNHSKMDRVAGKLKDFLMSVDLLPHCHLLEVVYRCIGLGKLDVASYADQYREIYEKIESNPPASISVHDGGNSSRAKHLMTAYRLSCEHILKTDASVLSTIQLLSLTHCDKLLQSCADDSIVQKHPELNYKERFPTNLEMFKDFGLILDPRIVSREFERIFKYVAAQIQSSRSNQDKSLADEFGSSRNSEDLEEIDGESGKLVWSYGFNFLAKLATLNFNSSDLLDFFFIGRSLFWKDLKERFGKYSDDRREHVHMDVEDEVGEGEEEMSTDIGAEGQEGQVQEEFQEPLERGEDEAVEGQEIEEQKEDQEGQESERSQDDQDGDVDEDSDDSEDDSDDSEVGQHDGGQKFATPWDAVEACVQRDCTLKSRILRVCNRASEENNHELMNILLNIIPQLDHNSRILNLVVVNLRAIVREQERIQLWSEGRPF